MGLQKKGEILQDHFGSFHAASFLDEKPFAIACASACCFFVLLHVPFPSHYLSALGSKIASLSRTVTSRDVCAAADKPLC